jgi:acyl-CoA oxidase
MVTWHCEKTSRICRERCGGGSYLENTLIGQGVFSAHSGMTAEGDNSVLMQKVVKDLLTHQRKGKHQMPQIKQQTIKTIS